LVEKSAAAEATSDFQAAPDVDLDDLDLEEGTELSLDDADLVEKSAAAEATSDFQAAPDVDLDDLDLSEELATVAVPEEAPQVGGVDNVGAAFDEAIEVNFDDMESDMDMGSEYTAMSNVEVGEDEVLELDVDELDAYSHTPAPRAESGAAKATGMIGSDVLLGIPHQLSVEVGSVSLSGRDILDLSYGSVISLERNVGEPVDLVLEGRRIAQGEIVLINGNHLGVRIVALDK
jgi:flagellar motor switch protein FliN/FliY